MNRVRIAFAVLVLVLAAVPALDSASARKPVAVYQCNDGIDNDGDGLTDYPADPACIGPYDYSERPQCSDGIDNNGDGVTDYSGGDETCSSPTDDTEADIPPNGVCSDGYDNDLDGKVDWPADPNCKSASGQSEGPAGK
jgi:hypothetical protein